MHLHLFHSSLPSPYLPHSFSYPQYSFTSNLPPPMSPSLVLSQLSLTYEKRSDFLMHQIELLLIMNKTINNNCGSISICNTFKYAENRNQLLLDFVDNYVPYTKRELDMKNLGFFSYEATGKAIQEVSTFT